MESISKRDRLRATLRVLLITQPLMAAWLCLLRLPDLYPVLKQEPWPFLAFSLSYRAVIVIAALMLIFLPRGGIARLPRPEPVQTTKQTLLIVAFGLVAAYALAHIISLVALPLDRWLPVHRWFPLLEWAFGLATGGGAGHSVWEWPWTLRLLNTSLGAPITEELFFRIYLYGHLRYTLGRTWALTLSTALFTLWHWGAPPSLLLGIAAAGFMNALVYETSGRMWAPILTHGLYNFLVLLPIQGWAVRIILGIVGGVALTAWVYRPAWLQPVQRWLPGHLARLLPAPAVATAAGEQRAGEGS